MSNRRRTLELHSFQTAPRYLFPAVSEDWSLEPEGRNRQIHKGLPRSKQKHQPTRDKKANQVVKITKHPAETSIPGRRCLSPASFLTPPNSPGHDPRQFLPPSPGSQRVLQKRTYQVLETLGVSSSSSSLLGAATVTSQTPRPHCRPHPPSPSHRPSFLGAQVSLLRPLLHQQSNRTTQPSDL